jgi:hypothetical protein
MEYLSSTQFIGLVKNFSPKGFDSFNAIDDLVEVFWQGERFAGFAKKENGGKRKALWSYHMPK